MEPSTGWGWLWQGIIANWMFWAIMGIAGLAGGFLKSKGGKWLPILYNGLLSAGLVGLIIFTGNLQIKLSMEEKAKTTINNIESKARTWLDKFQIATQSLPGDDVHFRYIATTPNNVKINVCRLKKHDNALIFYVNLITDKNEIDKFSQTEQHKIKEQIGIEASKLRLGFNVENLSKVTIEKAIPITPNLTETEFMAEIQSMTAGLLIVKSIIEIGKEEKTSLHKRGGIKAF
jgi:hypothetical protein